MYRSNVSRGPIMWTYRGNVSTRYIETIRPRPAAGKPGDPTQVIYQRFAVRRNVGHMRSQRSVVDYGLARRATLASLWSGRLEVTDACDAHPYLLRAAQYHGEPTDKSCPVCRRERLTHVTYVYGDELGRIAGRAAGTDELAAMAREYGEFRVYVVEVCQGCSWNHLTVSYILGHGRPSSRGAEV